MPLRIAQIAPPWFAVPPKGYGGIEWVVAVLTDGLVDRGHEVTLYASGDSTTKAQLVSVFDEGPGARAIGLSYYESLHATRAYLDAEKFDVIHDHSGFVGVAIGAMQSRAPVVHTLHGPFTEQAKEWYRQVSGRVSLVAISEAQRAFCPDLSYGGTVYNGIPMDHYPFREDKDDYLLFLGRINREKGPDLAVEVAKRAGVRLVMAIKKAEDIEIEYWDREVAPRLAGDEEIVGEISVEEKARLLAGARAVLFPIQWPEPFGLVMTEAMACGTPVLAFPKGAAPEVIAHERTGFLARDLDDMVACVGRLGEIDPHACRAHVEERFSGEAMVRGYEGVFARVLGRP